ncbi:MAG: T9SS type A sorting domain-containing protein [Crocinitomicaceae bacterium]
MKNLKTRLIPILLCLGISTSYGQDVEQPFSWASGTPSNTSSVGLFQCGTMNMTLTTSFKTHVLSGTSAFISSLGALDVPVTLTFSKPVCNLSVLIRDIDEYGGGPSEWLEFTGANVPSGISPSAGGPPFSYDDVLNIADPDGVDETEAWVNWDGPLTSISFIYHRATTNLNFYLDSLKFDCDCSTPEDLHCCEGNGWQTLSWGDVPSAVGYDIEFGFNDASSGCCDSVTGLPTGWMENVTDNVFLVPETFADCFWWRVRAEFSDGSKSEWSEKMCDCFDDGNACEAPINLDCEVINSAGEKVLSWDLVPGALGYEVSMTYNDPECCPTGPDPIETVVQTTTNTFIDGIPPNPCFSWKVRTICSEEPTYSDWSETKCSSDCPYVGTFKASQNRIEVYDGDDSNRLKEEISIVPNPANEFVTITLSGRAIDANAGETVLSITNITGIEVYRGNIEINAPKRVEIKDLKTGVYICTVFKGEEVVSSNKLIVE